MFPEDIKKFVMDSNKEKNMIKDFESSLRNQDIKTKVSNVNQSQVANSGNYGTASVGPSHRFSNTKNLASITTLQSQANGGGGKHAHTEASAKKEMDVV
eukprot:CAMPEP_0185598392 /NCGR_PEP_ID=MMETSP0434-20130131/81960_1 /TAXON_ID=626734 ORGANISM="Favella taraikaensis, Strain Fe Narragansett Bay" /NCGR_SAMPLE_ID=MMETSP0434 /ASSEMBLY_ACC=CAM_ASM_000379 /LENGTH=98 /DNA_ID=CAMNT_0028227347 /DNA_START=1556 /DNA_END=1852 /DNA_ORIENTATION=-